MIAALSRGRPRLDLRGVVVLVVEDDYQTRDALRRMVESFGAAVLSARDGREALALVSSALPDLVLLDVRMPGMDGFDFIDYLRERRQLSRIPVLALTAREAGPEAMRAWEAGFNGHLARPVAMDVVEAELERVFWAHRRAQQ